MQKNIFIYLIFLNSKKYKYLFISQHKINDIFLILPKKYLQKSLLSLPVKSTSYGEKDKKCCGNGCKNCSF